MGRPKRTPDDPDDPNDPSDPNGPDGPTTRTEFEARLELLVRAADANGVRVEGGFGLRHPAPDAPDWAIELSELRKRRPGGERGLPTTDRERADRRR